MTYVCVIFLTFTYWGAFFAISIVRANTFITKCSIPSLCTTARTINWITCTKFTLTFWRTILSIQITRTIVKTFNTSETGSTITFSSYMMTLTFIITFTLFITIGAIKSAWTTISAHITRPTYEYPIIWLLLLLSYVSEWSMSNRLIIIQLKYIPVGHSQVPSCGLHLPLFWHLHSDLHCSPCVPCGQVSVHKGPVKPGAHIHSPETWWHFPPFAHRHSSEQFKP